MQAKIRQGTGLEGSPDEGGAQRSKVKEKNGDASEQTSSVSAVQQPATTVASSPVAPASTSPVTSASTSAPLSYTSSAASSASPSVHPMCTRSQTKDVLVPSKVIADARSKSQQLPRSRGATWTDVMRKADARLQQQAPVPRPRGRPPSKHTWDSEIGQYVPISFINTTPVPNSAWILASLNPDLVADHKTPTAFQEALSGPDAHHWRRAIQDELASLRDCGVWKVIVASAMCKGSKAIPTKWVFKIKVDNEGRVLRFKARLVVCGYRQKLGRDYDLTFATVAHIASIRMLLAMAVARGMKLRQYDIKTAFLYGVLPSRHIVYLRPPQGVSLPHGHVLRLVKAMYGLKQAPLCWNRHLHGTLTKLGFSRSAHDPCLYYRRGASGETMLLAVVVDDIILASTSQSFIDEFTRAMKNVYNVTELGHPARLIGLAIETSGLELRLSQRQFIRDLAAKFGQSQSNPVSTPAVSGTVSQGQSPLLPEGHDYLSLVGSLLWVTITRLDVLVAVSHACAKAVRPTVADRAAAIRILRYLLHTPEIRLVFSPNRPFPLVCVFVDASWANEPKSRSRYGYLVLVCGCPVLWVTKNTSMVCLSTAEAEYVAAVEAAKSGLWIANMLAEVLGQPVQPVTIYEDNNACIRMATNPVVSARNRHFAMRMWGLRDHVEGGTILFVHVPTKEQLADILTKILAAPQFAALRDLILLRLQQFRQL